MGLISGAAALALAAVCAVSVVSLLRLWRDERAGNRLRERSSRICDAAGGAGISLLCTGVRSIEEVERLLCREYARFETIAVVDGAGNPRLLEEFVSAWSLFRTDYRPDTELPVFGVRGLYRSQCRCYRRLIVLDRERTLPSDDWDAAAGIASFDWLLPLKADREVLPRGLERLIAEVNRAAPEQLRAVVSTVGEPALLIARSEWVAVGGFSPRPLRHVHRSRLRRIGEPVFADCRPAALRDLLAVPATLLALAALACLTNLRAAPFLFVLCSFAVGASVWGAAPLVAPESPPWTARLAALKWLLGKITVKNFTIS